MRRRISRKKIFKLFLKTGEVYHTRKTTYTLPDEKSRSRNIFGIAGDLLGIPTYISECITKNLAYIMPGFSYKDTIKTYQDKLTKIAKGKIYNDWDGAANDANQHYELREAECRLIEKIRTKMHQLIPLPGLLVD